MQIKEIMKFYLLLNNLAKTAKKRNVNVRGAAATRHGRAVNCSGILESNLE